jgi:hypothetical protein
LAQPLVRALRFGDPVVALLDPSRAPVPVRFQLVDSGLLRRQLTFQAREKIE